MYQLNKLFLMTATRLLSIVYFIMFVVCKYLEQHEFSGTGKLSKIVINSFYSPAPKHYFIISGYRHVTQPFFVLNGYTHHCTEVHKSCPAMGKLSVY